MSFVFLFKFSQCQDLNFGEVNFLQLPKMPVVGNNASRTGRNRTIGVLVVVRILADKIGTVENIGFLGERADGYEIDNVFGD